MNISPSKRLVLIVGTAATLAATPTLRSNAATKKSTAPVPAGTEAVTGPVVNTRWGPVQVKILVADHKLTDITVPVYPNHKNRSIRINDRALPILHNEVLASQSAKVDNVSGATVTTIGYVGSLQQAIDSAMQKGLL
jgi:uncharacterized protein with FMN-binding domain